MALSSCSRKQTKAVAMETADIPMIQGRSHVDITNEDDDSLI